VQLLPSFCILVGLKFTTTTGNDAHKVLQVKVSWPALRFLICLHPSCKFRVAALHCPTFYYLRGAPVSEMEMVRKTMDKLLFPYLKGIYLFTVS